METTDDLVREIAARGAIPSLRARLRLHMAQGY